MILKGYIFGILYALVCLALSFILYKLGLAKKYTRKVVHILVGFEWVILYNFMGAGPHFLAVCIFFLILLTIAYKGRLMPMISSDGDNAPGTVYYAAAMTGVAIVGCFVPEVMLPFGIGVMCTSVGDGLAGVAGQLIKKGNPKIYGEKTLLGALTNFLGSAASAFVISAVYSIELTVLNCLIIGMLSTGLELITPYGLDNVSITWATTALAYSFVYFDSVSSYILPIILTPFIIALVISKKSLTKGGIALAILLDVAVSLAFGNVGFVILCSFFCSSIIVDKVKKHAKNSGRNDITAKGDCRDYAQVIANGGVAFASSILFLLTRTEVFFICFVAALAEAFADTVASGIGAFSRKTFDPFRWRKCESGISGGMSLVGTLASLVGALLISFVAYLFGFEGYGVSELFTVAVAAFLGAVFDSFIGSVFQVKYKCSVCGKITERAEHCDTTTERFSGMAAIDNDAVNIISSIFSAVLSAVIFLVCS